ncbi:hypothetical protein [Salinigranum marinum]|uniref:hypothetical protein n=1 Tax=Salinigranum marinum TaxID=1515595 RepID=UPI002989C9E1|nr:hypothetical protein [Salinigranum marinum]
MRYEARIRQSPKITVFGRWNGFVADDEHVKSRSDREIVTGSTAALRGGGDGQR